MYRSNRSGASIKIVLAVCILASLAFGIVGQMTSGAEAVIVPELLKDILPGAGSSINAPSNLPAAQAPVALGGVSYFIANDGTNGRELWRTDGTTAGTSMVKDIRPGPAGSHDAPQKIVKSGGLLFFKANDGTHGLELWRSDGTEAGTQIVKDVFPGATEPPVSRADEFADVGGTIFFAAFSTGVGQELWRSDGTEAGTLIVSDITPGSTSSDPASLMGIGDQCFFIASNKFGRELWRSDGTPAGTFMVKDIFPPTSSSATPQYFTNVGGVLFFHGNDGFGFRLWRSDGTTAGTFKVSSQAAPQAFDPFFSTMVDFNGMLFFSATTDSSDPDTRGFELWRSDGTSAGTFRVRDIRPGANSSNPQDLTVSGGKLFFRANNGPAGVELWRSDGTEAGTALVRDIAPSGGSQPDFMTDIGGVLYFTASDTTGNELWKSDGTAAGTVRVADIVPGPVSSSPQLIASLGTKVLFTADDGVHGRELWMLNLNAAPNAADDVATTNEDNATTIDVRANDTDPNGDPLTLTAVTQGTHGLVEINADGTVSFTPEPNFFGGDSFTYTIDDGHGATATATVSVNVLPVNDAPVASNGVAGLNEDAQIQISLSASDIDNDTLTFSIASGPANGSVTLNGGTVVYAPDPNFNGQDAFSFVANDGAANSNIATVMITVTPVDDPPVLAVIGNQVIAEGALLAFNLSASDPDGPQQLTFGSTALPAGASLDPASGAFSWTPVDGQAGVYTIVFSVIDPTGLAALETITITVTDVVFNEGPVCSGAFSSISEIWPADRRMVPLGIFGVTDPDNDPLAIVVTRILQDEPTNAAGDGNTPIDASGVGTAVPVVRAERSGHRNRGGNGRVYEIFFDASDGRGGSCTGSIKVGVPHDQGHGPAVDDGRRYDSTVAGGGCLNCDK